MATERRTIVSVNTSFMLQNASSHKPKKSSPTEQIRVKRVHEALLREQLENFFKNFIKNDRASAPSREKNESYNEGDKDRLWCGGRGTIPAGLIQGAQKEGDEDENSDNDDMAGGGDGGGDKGDGDGGEQEVETQSRKYNGSSRLATYFLPGEGIDREVIKTDICRYLGPDALVKPGVLADSWKNADAQRKSGFFFTAYRSLTTDKKYTKRLKDQLKDIKDDSARWAAEKARNRQSAGEREEDGYRASITRAREQDTPSPYFNPSSASPRMQGQYDQYERLIPQMNDNLRSSGTTQTPQHATDHPQYQQDSGHSYLNPLRGHQERSGKR